MPTLTSPISFGTSKTTKPKIRKAVFGDGYQQRVANGINTQARQWAVTFNDSSVSIDSVEAFLVALNGSGSFDWTPPDSVAGKFICEEWTRSYDDYNNETISCVFSEVFGE